MTSWLLLRLVAFALGFIAAPVLAQAQADAEARFAETEPGPAGATLHRIGTATVNRNFLPFYALGLYVPPSVRSLGQLRDALSPYRLSLVWLVPELDAGAAQDYWRRAIETSAGKDDYPRIQPQVERLAQTFGSARRDQHITFDYVPDAGMRVLVDNQPVAQLAGVEFNRAFLGIWFSDQAVPEVRDHLTAGFAQK